MERYHATGVLSLTARHSAQAWRTPSTGCNGAPPTASGLISTDLSSAAPLVLDLREDVEARGFSEGEAARPITVSQPPGRPCKTSKHYRSRLAKPLFFKAVR
jgi:hypothetical protein